MNDKEGNVENVHRVDNVVWDKWGNEQRKLFTELFERMVESPWAFKHPNTPAIPAACWETIAWNAAWIAADMLKGVRWLANDRSAKVMYAV